MAPTAPLPPTQCRESKAEWWAKQSASPTLRSRGTSSCPVLLQKDAAGPLRTSPHLATSCGPCPSCLHQQRPARHGPPLFCGRGPPTLVCPLEKDISDLDCPHLGLPGQQRHWVWEGRLAFCDPSPLSNGGLQGMELALGPRLFRETGNSLGCRARTQLIPKTRSPQLDTPIRPAECEALVGSMGHGSQTWVEEGAPGPRSSSCRSRSRPSHHGSHGHGALVLRGVQGNAGCERAKIKDLSITLNPTASRQQVNNDKDDNSDRSPCRSETVPTGTHTQSGVWRPSAGTTQLHLDICSQPGQQKHSWCPRLN